MPGIGGLLRRIAGHVENESPVEREERPLPDIDGQASAAPPLHLAHGRLDHADGAAETREVLLVPTRRLRVELPAPDPCHIAPIIAASAWLPITCGSTGAYRPAALPQRWERWRRPLDVPAAVLRGATALQ